MKSLHCCTTNNVANEINGHEIEIGFLNINFIRGNLAVETHIFLSIYENMIKQYGRSARYIPKIILALKHVSDFFRLKNPFGC
jgi:hypothetical protein